MRVSLIICISLSAINLVASLLAQVRGGYIWSCQSKLAMTVRQSTDTAVLKIGTRASPLALAQAYETKRLLGVHFPELAEEGAVVIQKIMTKVKLVLTLFLFYKLM